MPTVPIHSLDAISFAPFGDVIEVSDRGHHYSINEGHTERYHDLAKIDTAQQGGRTLLSIFRSNPLPMPIVLKVMERHPLASQAFMPLGTEPYLVVVAPPGEFNEDAVKVFLAQPGQGVNYHRGTWHHYCLALHKISDFLVVDRGGEGKNCDLVQLTGNLLIELTKHNEE
jgi:ureidoglycolate lyase